MSSPAGVWACPEDEKLLKKELLARRGAAISLKLISDVASYRRDIACVVDYPGRTGYKSNTQ
jgi:hypothetical protein